MPSSSRLKIISGENVVEVFGRDISTARAPKLSVRVFEARFVLKIGGDKLKKTLYGSKNALSSRLTCLHTVDCCRTNVLIQVNSALDQHIFQVLHVESVCIAR